MTRQSTITVLDGGMGRQLKALGAPFKLPEWSALALLEGPDYVRLAHEQFIAAGADVITTNSYSILPHQLGEVRFDQRAVELAALAGRLARAAAETKPGIRVAGSIPPLFGSYVPERFDAKRAPGILQKLIDGLAPYVDLWLIETQSSIIEVEAAFTALRSQPQPIWVSYTLKDEIGRTARPEIRSGETVRDAVAAAQSLGAVAVLFNCSQAEVMEPALREANATTRTGYGTAIPLGVYANAFVAEPASKAAYAGISHLRDDLQPGTYLDLAQRWHATGASIIGGCCGIGPEHISQIRRFADQTH
jgi:S-methylmethionine-dependent homocysteine/selenocysteine methylase